jgi:hypothetical protein
MLTMRARKSIDLTEALAQDSGGRARSVCEGVAIPIVIALNAVRRFERAHAHPRCI